MATVKSFGIKTTGNHCVRVATIKKRDARTESRTDTTMTSTRREGRGVSNLYRNMTGDRRPPLTLKIAKSAGRGISAAANLVNRRKTEFFPRLFYAHSEAEHQTLSQRHAAVLR